MSITGIIKRTHANSSRTLRNAVATLQRPNKADSDAVEARKELDLRLGAIFTRFQTTRAKSKFSELANELLSFGNPFSISL